MDYNINLGSWGSIFAVPRAVVEKYIKLSSGSALKVLLYVLCKNTAVPTEVLMTELNLSKEAVEDAFCFWEQVGLFSDNNTPDAITGSAPDAVPAAAVTPAAASAAVRQHSTGSLTPREIAERIEFSEEIAFLFKALENTLGSILTHTEQRSLIWIHDYLGLPGDVIIMLIDYCKSIDKTGARYMEKVALSWQEKDILTVEAAEREIAQQAERHTLTARVSSAFGITRKLSTKEAGFISEWAAKKFDLELISYAYDKTVDAINKLSFPYINKILMGWADKGLSTREDVDRRNESAPHSDEHSYDLDKFDELAIRFKAAETKERDENS